MKKSFVALLLLAGVAFLSVPAFAGNESDGDMPNKLVNAQEIQERLGGASKLRVSGTSDDTVYVGHSKSAGVAPWYIFTGPYLPSPDNPSISGNQDGYWGWENFNAGANDSLMGWWPFRRIYNITGGLTRTDTNRPWWALDYGNVVNYVLNSNQQDRTIGVNGVWHSDAGNAALTTTAGTNPVAPGWAPISGAGSAWCGLRGHGDLTAMDLAAQGGYNNPFNGDAHMFMDSNSAAGTSAKNWPGYASQWDQMLYRDIVVPAGQSLTISFDYRTAMSTDRTLTAATRTGWFDGDPRSMSGSNFISSSGAPDLNAPIDSFMVYIGQPVDVNACSYSDGGVEPVYDVRRRWKNEVLKRTAVKEILSDFGTSGGTESVSQTISAANLAPYRDSGGRVRVCFRVKTNRGFDDTGTGYSSGGAGAAIVDNVVLDHSGTGGVDISSGFDSASEINNTPQGDGYATNSWKSTGKPPGIYAHTHPLDGGDIGGGNVYDALVYSDLCGPPNSPARFCDIFAVVISVGDHDNFESAGAPDAAFMPGDREVMEGIISPTINLRTPGATPNAQGLTDDIVDVVGDGADYWIFYDMGAFVYNLFFTGNAWTFGFQSYPVVQANGSRAWGEVRQPGFQIFNPDPQCFKDFEPGIQLGLVSTSNGPTDNNGYPDSLRIYLGKNQQCFRFAAPLCSPTDGTYFDNVSLAFIDETAGPLRASSTSVLGGISMDIWRFIQDSFPSNATNGLAGTAPFDTTAAWIQTGINTAQASGNEFNYDIPGDTTLTLAANAGIRVDMVFRVLPGVGNYVTVGNTSSGVRRRPDQTTQATAGDGSWWGSYLASNDGGSGFGSSVGHSGNTWNKNVWNSARCDTIEVNYFPVAARGNLSALTAGQYANMLHEQDPKFSTLGISKHRCFLVDTAGSINSTNTTCSSVPAWLGVPAIAARAGYPGTPLTLEYTKIIPDGQLTPGAHVQYFFRKSELSAPSVFVACPDTQFITPQASEGSTDGHRFQQFSILPDRWKDGAFGGQGMACALVVDLNDRRGNERAWVSTADSIGATASSKWGAHNGWHVFPGYVSSTSDQDYTAEIVGGDPTIAVWSHGGQPGTTWDMYQVKASESLTTSAGSFGSRLATQPGGGELAAGKSSRQGPTPDMLRRLYRLIIVFTGDLTSGILGPFNNRSQDDVTLLKDFVDGATGTAKPRGLMFQGNGFVQAENELGNLPGAVGTAHASLLSTYLAVQLRNENYQALSGNFKNVADLLPTSIITTNGDIYGVQNTCTFSNDTYNAVGAAGGQAASFWENFGVNGPYIASVYAPPSVAHSHVSLVDGWDIENLRARYDDTNRGRLAYFYNALSKVFAGVCVVNGAAAITLDVPNNNRLSNFLSLSNNPVRTGSAQLHFGLAARDLVSIKLYDVAGREIATVAERYFEPGTHTLTWDGTDNAGRRVARGVYFAQVKFAQQKERFGREIVVLK